MLTGEASETHPLQSGNPAPTPRVKRLRSQIKRGSHNFRPDTIDDCAMRMTMPHTPDINAAFNAGKSASLIEDNGADLSVAFMQDLGARIRQRIADLDVNQTIIANATGLSQQRFGQYARGVRKPDIETLTRIARALRCSTDWLLGVSDAGPIEIKPIVLRLLELEGLDPDRAEAIAAAAQEALRILSGFPDEGDAALRSRLAAHAAWHAQLAPKPS